MHFASEIGWRTEEHLWENQNVFETLCACVFCFCAKFAVQRIYSVDPKVSALCVVWQATTNDLWRKKNQSTSFIVWVCFYICSVFVFRLPFPYGALLSIFRVLFCRCTFTGFRLGLIEWSVRAWNGLNAVTNHHTGSIHPFLASFRSVQIVRST